MHLTYALHSIHSKEALSFDPTAYSQFKFGDDAIAEQFGTCLAKGFINQHLCKQPIHQPLVVISSPYAFIPTATFAMKNYFVFEINKWLVNNQLPVLQETKVTRSTTYKDDYGALDAQARMKLIQNEQLHIDKHFVTHKTLVFLDDIKITGSHEKMITNMLHHFQLTNNTYLLYFAELINPTIHPNIENYLNYHYVKTIFDLNSIIKSNRFSINTRIVKYILNTPEELFKKFIQNQHLHFIHLLYNMALGNNYHTIEVYAPNLLYIKTMLYSSNNKN
jgi:hypothetical protein